MRKYILIFALVLFPLVSFASIDTNLKYGMRNGYVSELQDFLTDKGYMNQTTGFFGVITLNAVKKYQADNNIPSTGYVGILTRTQINKELDIVIASSTQAEVDETGSVTPVVTHYIYVPQNVIIQTPTEQITTNQTNTTQYMPTYTISEPVITPATDGTSRHNVSFTVSDKPQNAILKITNDDNPYYNQSMEFGSTLIQTTIEFYSGSNYDLKLYMGGVVVSEKSGILTY